MTENCPKCETEGENRTNGMLLVADSSQCPNSDCQVKWFSHGDISEQIVEEHRDECEDWTDDSCM